MSGLVDMLVSNMDMTSVLTGVTVFCIIGFLLSKRERSGIPPGPNFLPLLGNVLDMRGKYLGKRYQYFDDMMAKYGTVFRIYFGRTLVIVLCDFESINEAFVKQKELLSGRPVDKLWDVQQSNKTGVGLIWSNDQHWKIVRRMTLHTLRDLGVGKKTLEVRIKDETNYVIDAMIHGKPVTVCEILMKATSNIISSVVFGSRFDYDDPEFIHLLSMMTAAFEGEGPFSPINVLPQIRFIPVVATKLNDLIKGFEQLTNFISRKISEHKETLEKDNPRDFIDVGLSGDADSNPISEETLLKTILELFLAGSDTTANTLDWAFLYMILNPDVQIKCQQEIDNVVGSGRMVDWGDRHKLPYVEATILEVQRIANIAPLALPHTTIKDTMIKGYLIPKGCMVFAHLRACHLDANAWEQPLDFKPERFLGDDGKPTKDQNFLPFSTGPRICPGEPLARMSMFLIFTNILQKFSLYQYGSDELSTEGIFGVTMSTKPYLLQAECR